MSIQPPPPLDPRQHVQALYEERVANSLWCKSQADVANFADGCLYGRFLNELLQNTDDSRGTELAFEMVGKKLVITHDGRHFNHTDVEKIISFSNQEFRDKSVNAQMTGYKGIGFKALLSLTEKVHIISGGYSFRFDKFYWKKHPHTMPWQMIPIWTETEKKEGLHSQKVTFIFHLTQAAFIEKEFDVFLKEPRSTLFLRHIRKITFEYKLQKAVVERKDLGPDRSLLSPSHASSWLITSKEIPVPKDLHQAIQELNSTICPDRLKQAKMIEISFAFILINEKLAAPSQAQDLELFNTLPTKMRVGLPFAVNAEFLLEAQREHLVRSEWNAYLFENIAFLHFSFLCEFAKGKHWEHILNILAPMTLSGVEKELSEAYSKGFKMGYKTVAWIPSSSDPHQLLKLEECYIDETGFYQTFKEDLPPNLMPEFSIHPKLSNVKKLSYLIRKIAPHHVLEESDIINQLESIFQKRGDPKLCFRILMFLKQREPKHHSGIYHPFWNQLKERAFIPTEGGRLKKLSELCLPQEESRIPLPDFIEISVMHPAIFELDSHGDLKSWLVSKGMSDLSTKSILKKYIYPHCEVGKISKEQSIELVRYLFALFSEGLIDNSDLKGLQTIPLATQEGTLRSAREIYISKAYQIEQESTLEDLLPNHPHLFIHSLYKKKDEKTAQWREFFLELGATEKLDLCIKSSSVKGLFEQNIDQLKEYLNYLHSAPNPVIGRSYLMDDYYRNVVFFPMMGNLKDPLFAKLFWKRLSLCASRFIETDQKCEFIDRKNNPRSLRTYDKVSYLRFMLREIPCIPGTDEKFHKIQDLYSPAFRSLNSPEVIAAAIEPSLSPELIQYLGFKTRISPSNCYELLQKMRKEQLKNLDLYKTLIQELLVGWKFLAQKSQKELLEKDWFFLAHNNEWVNIHSLSCFAVKGSSPSLQSNCYLKAVSEDMEAVATLFKRPVIKDWVAIEAIQGARVDQESRNNFLQRLPLMAWFYAHYSLQSSETVLKDLVENVRRLQIFKADSIPTYDENTFLDLAVDQNTIYYTDKCNKYNLIEAIGRLLGFPSDITKELYEVYSLKNERFTRRRKTVEEWVQEKGIPKDELEMLHRCIETLDLSPIGSSSSGETSTTTDHHEALSDTMIEIEESISSSDEEDRPVVQTSERSNSLHGTSPRATPSNLDIKDVSSQLARLNLSQSSSSKNPAENETLENEWTATIPIDQIHPSKQDIQNLQLKKRPSYSLEAKTSGEKVPKSRSKSSNHGDSVLGKWGEAFALKALLYHYEKKHSSNFAQTSEGSYQLTRKGVIEIGVQWLNQSVESCQPYDLLLTKKKIDAELITYPIEVKATKGESVHFFMSDGEWKTMKTHPNYRLYMVLKAGNSDAEIYKIPNPRNWVKEEEIRIKKKYEVVAAKA